MGCPRPPAKLLVLGAFWLALVAGRLPPSLLQRSHVLGVLEMVFRPDRTDVLERHCLAFGRQADSDYESKEFMRSAGAIHQAVKAMRRHPNHKGVQGACTKALMGLLLFQRENGLLAAELGGMELVMASMKRFPDDPDMQNLGVYGCFMDFCPENRIKFGQLGGIELVLDTIRRHYNNTWVQFMGWAAFSSGVTDNELAFRNAGGLDLALRSLRDHPGSAKNRIREEVLQVTKSIGRYSAQLRDELLARGFLRVLLDVMREEADDLQCQSLGCENLAFVLRAPAQAAYSAVAWGAAKPEILGSITLEQLQPDNATVASMLLEAGALDALLSAVRREQELDGGGHEEQSAQHFESNYNVLRNAFWAMAHMAIGSPEARAALIREEAPRLVVEGMARKPHNVLVQASGCWALRALAAGDEDQRMAVATAQPPAWCAQQL